MILKDRIIEDMKNAMRSQDKARLAVIRLMQAAIKQFEVDERKPADDAQVILLLDKMLKQRRESVAQYEKANRNDLVDQEQYEMNIIQSYLPKPFSDQEIDEMIDEAVKRLSIQTIQEMGKLMAELKPKLVGRADMNMVSRKIKERLT